MMEDLPMRSRSEWYQIQKAVATHLPALRPAQQDGLAWWVYGTILAGSACQTAVVGALVVVSGYHAARQFLREWLYDGEDRAAPCQTAVDVRVCFAPLLRWVIGWWQGTDLALAVDATSKGDDLVVLSISVLYRGTALPVAWHVLPANQPGAWMPHLLRLLRRLRPALPTGWRVIVLADRGLWSPRLFKRIRNLGWHPLLRLQNDILFPPVGQQRRAARQLLNGPGSGWVGKGIAFRNRPQRRAGTLIALWGTDEKDPWLLLTDLPPERVGVCWYGLRIWIELGFRALKGMGWQWQRTRRTDPARVARHWLVLAIATLWSAAVGTRAEDAIRLKRPPSTLRAPVPITEPLPARPFSVLRQGLTWLREQVRQRRFWRLLWLSPEPWPQPPPDLTILYQVQTT
jgi:Transposase DDE domain